MAQCTLTLLVCNSAAARARLPVRMNARKISSFLRVNSSSISMAVALSRMPSIVPLKPVHSQPCTAQAQQHATDDQPDRVEPRVIHHGGAGQCQHQAGRVV